MDKIKNLLKNYKIKLVLEIFIAILVLFINFSLAYNLGRTSVEPSAVSDIFGQNSDFDPKYKFLFNEVWQIIKENFVDQKRVDPNKAAFEAVRGLVKSLNDPYSDLYTPTQSKIIEEDLQGKFCGVGMEIGIRNNVLTVISPLEDTPAYRKGIKAGDLILKINNEDTYNMSLEEAVSKIRGKCGEKVVLTIFREGWQNERDFEIVREEIKIKMVKYDFIPPDIGHIKILNFGDNAVNEFINAYNDLRSKGAKRFIIDVRNNPGGYLQVAIKLSELFLPRGKIILKEVWGKEQNERVIRSTGVGNLSKLKMVILANKGSASASEIFAAALRDNLGTKIIGEKTFGKGSVQQIFEVGPSALSITIPIQNKNTTTKEIKFSSGDSYSLKLTVAYWLTPKGVKLEGNGIEPDIKVIDPNPEDNKDEILQKAIEIIKKL